MKEMHLVQAKVYKNELLSPEIFSMELYAPEIANSARAGQFVMVYLDKGELLLPRPISFCNTNPSAGTIVLVYQVVGKGTKAMSEMAAGQTLRLLGALGNGFNIKGRNGTGLSRVALVGGGIGVPPLLLLAETLAKNEVIFDVYLGFRTAPILLEQFSTVADKLFVTTEDGSFGHRGFITEVLNSTGHVMQTIEKFYDEILSCGPEPMLRAVADYAKSVNIPCQMCMESRMACGLGTCVGCVVVAVLDSNGLTRAENRECFNAFSATGKAGLNLNGAKAGERYVLVCSDGPVFYCDEVNV